MFTGKIRQSPKIRKTEKRNLTPGVKTRLTEMTNQRIGTESQRNRIDKLTRQTKLKTSQIREIGMRVKEIGRIDQRRIMSRREVNPGLTSKTTIGASRTSMRSLRGQTEGSGVVVVREIRIKVVETGWSVRSQRETRRTAEMIGETDIRRRKRTITLQAR